MTHQFYATIAGMGKCLLSTLSLSSIKSKTIVAASVLLTLNSATNANAQTISDTLYSIDQLEVTAAKTVTPNTGARSTTIPTHILEKSFGLSLSELISDNSTIYIKSQGRGAMATASFRGTSSNHTQVSWNGISINSPTLGNFDFSQIPVFLTDNVALHHGASGYDKGSGALGGNVDFSNSHHNINGQQFDILSEYGSFNTFTEGVAYRNRWGNLASSTKLYYQSSSNDYKYLNKVMSHKPFIERRKNAEYMQAAIMQELYFLASNGGVWKAIAWWQSDYRNLPPAIIVHTTAKESQDNNNLRALIGYNKGTLNITAGYIYYNSLYSKSFDNGYDFSEKSRNKSHSISINAEQDFQLHKTLKLGYGAMYRYDLAKSDNFTQGKAHRNTITARLRAKYNPIKDLTIQAQAMAEAIDTKVAPTYNIGAQYQMLDGKLWVKAANAYNYRFPTLNDLYWTPGGNPDLKPEKGFSNEITLGFSTQTQPVSLRGEVTYYRMDIEDWIMWIPTGNGYIWSPCNFSKVLSQGAEVALSLTHQQNAWINRLNFNYTYAYSVDKSDRPDFTQDKQLPYIPRNKWNLSYLLSWKDLTFNCSYSFTDVRFTSADESYYTNAYFILNASIEYSLRVGKKSRINFNLKVDNILNDYYESTQYYPMPLRSITIGARAII